MNSEIDLSLVILCYRSEENAIPFAARAKEIVANLTDKFEIILVGNYLEGSTDTTQQVVQEIAANDPMIKAICKPKEGMMGWDMKSGMDMAEGKLICVIDGDGQFPLESISECYKHMVTGGYDLVKTYRETRNDGWYRTLISSVYNALFAILFPGLKCKDVNSKPKIIKNEAYNAMNLSSNDWFLDAEIMINIRRMNYNFYEFPVEFMHLENRPSFVKPAAILEFIRNLIAFRVREFGKSRKSK